MDSSPKRILLLRTDRLGDVVLTSPAASLLHEHLREAHVTFLVRAYTRDLLQLHRHVDEILVYEPEGRHRGISGLRVLVHELREGRFDAALFFYPRPRLALAAWLAGIPLRIGTRYKWYAPLFDTRLPQRRRSGGLHEAEYNLQLLTPLLGSIPETIRFHFEIPDSLRAWRLQWLRTQAIGNDYVILHPGSGGSAPNLSFSQYRFVASTLLESSTLPLVLTGSAAEHRQVEELRDSLGSPRVRNCAGTLNLVQLAALVEGASFFVSSSTGPLHVANAFGIPLVAFYCPSPPCSPRRWGPYGQLEWVLTPDVVPCAHCKPQRCMHGNCLEKMPASALRAILQRRLAASGVTSAE
jgi:ADP-heptose:LPS heptosyltransferase